MDIIVTRGTAPNSDLLTDQIKASYPACTGISVKAAQATARVTAHFPDDLDPADVTAVEALITNHDEAQSTSEQAAAQNIKDALQEFLDKVDSIPTGTLLNNLIDLNEDPTVGGFIDANFTVTAGNILTVMPRVLKHILRNQILLALLIQERDN